MDRTNTNTASAVFGLILCKPWNYYLVLKSACVIVKVPYILIHTKTALTGISALRGGDIFGRGAACCRALLSFTAYCISAACQAWWHSAINFELLKSVCPHEEHNNPLCCGVKSLGRVLMVDPEIFVQAWRLQPFHH